MASNRSEESTQSTQRITTIVLAILAIIFLFLRLVARHMKRIGLGVDDWTLIVGLIFVLVIAGVNLACIEYGLGRHTDTIPPEELPVFLKLSYAFEPLYITTAGIIKLSVLFMYHRIFPVRLIKTGGYILGGVTLAWVISVDLVAIFQCDPIAKAYEPTLPGHCIQLKAALIGNGVPNFVTDILILALPARLIWRLQATLWQRVSIIGVFLTGSFVVFASIYRFSLIFIFNINDAAWTLADAQTWCVVETAAGVISACLPTTAPLVKTCTKGFISTARSLSKSNFTQSGTRTFSKGDAGATGSNTAENKMTGLRADGAHRSNGSYGLSELGPGGREIPHMKGKGWTIISADGESD
ncbi:hypothetical protein PMG11_05876 [Penicillium brasilianum]|uniref:Rhodopsin domain-containing protein n=1 Tax=Penicillium brasilianum TaxID=104259 RepID=A0A0F7TMR6_PENBI|nr:hypothetical protein PMG11_05876 [Penicillium brasilianum]